MFIAIFQTLTNTEINQNTVKSYGIIYYYKCVDMEEMKLLLIESFTIHDNNIIKGKYLIHDY